MYLKIITIEGFKKVKFKEEYKDFKTFKSFISELLKEKYENLNVVAFDNVKNRIIIKKEIDFKYLLEDSKDVKFKEIFIEKEKNQDETLNNFVKVPPIEKKDSEDFYLIKEIKTNIDEEEFLDISKKEKKINKREEDTFIKLEEKKIKKAYKIFEEKKLKTFEIKTVNKLITCKVCKKKDFIGKRFKCLICKDFNICENCESENEHLHPMVRLTENYDENLLEELNKNFIHLVEKFKDDKKFKIKYDEKKKMIEYIFGSVKNKTDEETREKFIKENIDLEIIQFNKILVEQKNNKKK